MRSDWQPGTVSEIAEFENRLRIPLSAAQRAVRHGEYAYWGANGPFDTIDDFIFEGPRVLVAEDGNTVVRPDGRGTVHWATGCYWVNNHAHVLNVKRGHDLRWLFYALSGARVGDFVSGSAQPKLSMGSLKRLPLRVPPYAEQRRIGAVLGALDDKLDSNRRLALLLEETAATIFKARFVDFVGVEDLEATEIGPVPHGWQVAPIGELLKVVGGSTPSTSEPQFWDGTHCWATPKDLAGVRSSILLDTGRHITDEGVARISSKLLPPRTVLLSSRAPVGYTAISFVEVAVNQGFIAIPPSDGMPSEFVLLWLREHMAEIKAHAGGTTFAEISKRAFRPLPMVVPPATELRAFEDVARPLFDLMAAQETEIHTLGHIRDLLLPKLISGEIRVPDTTDAEEVIGPVADEVAAVS